MTDQQITDQIDNDVLALALSVTARQQAHLAIYSRYCACGPTHTTPPADAASAVCDLAASKLPGYLMSAADLGCPASLTFQAQVSEYVGPDGPGFVVTVRASVNGVLQRRVINVGPEASRNLPWGPEPTGP